MGTIFVSPEERARRAAEPSTGYASWPVAAREAVERIVRTSTPERLAAELAEWPLSSETSAARAADVRRHDVAIELPAGNGAVSSLVFARVKAACDRVRMIAALNAYLTHRYVIAQRQDRDNAARGVQFAYESEAYAELLRRQPGWLGQAKAERDALLATLRENRAALAEADQAWLDSLEPFYPGEGPSGEMAELWTRLERATVELVASTQAIKEAAFERVLAQGKPKRIAAAFGIEFAEHHISHRWTVLTVDQKIAEHVRGALNTAGTVSSALAELFR